jgi:tRNA 2-thiouridine synthesizing protein A
MLAVAGAPGSACALLTPAIKGKLKELEPGQVLLVRTDDPAAHLDVAAWCSLTGNPLLGMREQGGVFSFFIKKQEVRGNG